MQVLDKSLTSSVSMQVLDKSQQAAGIVRQIIDLFAEKPGVYQEATGKRSAVELWSEGGLGVLTRLA